MASRFDPRHIEWAGVAVRLADGTTYAFEMTGHIEGEIRVEHQAEEMDLGLTYRTYRPVGTDVHIELHGHGIHSARFADAANEHQPRRAIAEGQREIEP